MGEPDAAATFCPPGVPGSGPQAAACLTHDPVAELHALQRDPAVLSAGRVSPTPLSVRDARGWEPLFSWVRYDGVRLYEHPRLVAGRLARDDAADEAEVSEFLARTHHLHPGSQLEVAGLTWDQFSQGNGQFEAPALPPRTITVTGIVRLPTDLTAVDEAGPTNLNAEVIFLGPGWVRATGEDAFARFQTSVAMRFRPGADRAAVLEAAAPGQTRNVAQGVVAEDIGDTRGTVAYEGRAAAVAAGVLAAAMAVLLGQMFVRQARRELPDGPALRALGMTRRALVLSVVPRWLVTAAVALGTAAALSAFLRPLGPIGVVARAPSRRPVRRGAPRCSASGSWPRPSSSWRSRCWRRLGPPAGSGPPRPLGGPSPHRSRWRRPSASRSPARARRAGCPAPPRCSASRSRSRPRPPRPRCSAASTT